MKSKILFLSGITASVLPLMPLAISCNPAEQKSEKTFDELTPSEKLKFIEEKFNKLDENDKKKFLNNSKALKELLTQDEIHTLIDELNKDAAQFGSIVWYIKSAESLIGKEQAFAYATKAFDELKANPTSKTVFDFSQNFNTAQKVDNPAPGLSIPVVFMDIDETVLQNDYTEAFGMLNGGYSGDMKETNDLKAKRFAVPGAVDFINHVQENGGLVIYQSDMNQSTAVVEAVKQNLKNVGVKYVENFQFWMRGSMPYVAENETDISDEKTKNLSEAQLKELAKKTKFTTDFSPKPWRTWTNSKAAYILGKLVYKTDRMQGTDSNTNGWDFSQEDSKSGDKVKTLTLMKIGDNFNDFFDRLSKGKANDERNKIYTENKKLQALFTTTNANALVAKKDGESYILEEVTNRPNAYILIPGNSEYGGWLDPYGYKNTFKNLYEELKAILADKKYETGPSI
ncbi:5'-nucleotidase, lipoprotein e(P4) family [Mycoplasmopsis californica]|uniref:Acid phosphatase n=1 Tax=Mycoplasmopsis equigenitalium TaxID=114883 RepID=A0ABY5J3S8_9BACT|nr:HAD family acid phosphatase [Mycoplasmopsis equigenitalium]UUD36802.1 acid phosphatase [Mycoplasmopsis equigenitalium]VEU69900.1 5'-nucleotidase, lipoprotein e(P4) family [Mycoplasmopsis californica]